MDGVFGKDKTTLGMVTGNNRYFALPPQRVEELHLRRSDLIPLSPPGSRHLRRLTFTDGARQQLGIEGASIWLFRPEHPSNAAETYIAAGENAGIDLAYKCQVRAPWWRVPYLKPADLLLTYMNADTPRLCTNRAGAHHLNSVHGIYLENGTRQLGRRLLALASLNTATMVGAELVGRADRPPVLPVSPSARAGRRHGRRPMTGRPPRRHPHPRSGPAPLRPSGRCRPGNS